MSPTRLVLDGLREFNEALRNLPQELTDEAADLVRSAAEQAKTEIQASYPEGPTGNLRAGVTREYNRSKFTTAAIVRSRAKHAHLFEFGTRRRETRRGANRGSMPQGPDGQRMIPIAIKQRRRLMDGLLALLQRAGFQVNR